MRTVAVLLATLLLATSAAADDYRPAGVNVVRWAKGEIAYRNGKTGAVTGNESWDLTVHPDGSRSLRATNYLLSSGFMHTVNVRVGADFRPLEAFAEYFIKGEFRGAALFAVTGTQLEATAKLTDSTVRQVVDVPERFSLIPHPLASDVWHHWYYDKAKGGPQPMTVYDIDAPARGPAALLGRVYTQTLRYIGQETVTVPAGTFVCDHYRVDDAVDYYVTGPDALFVKFVWPPANAEYVLTKLEQGQP
jgi:hypothetical protein